MTANPFDDFSHDEMIHWWNQFFGFLLQHDFYESARLLFPEMDPWESALLVETELQSEPMNQFMTQFMAWSHERLKLAEKRLEETRETR